MSSHELFYLYILRYHQFTGNLSFSQTIQDVYNCAGYCNSRSVFFPNNIGPALRNFDIPAQSYIQNHSILPFYKPFISQAMYQNYIEKLWKKGKCTQLILYRISPKITEGTLRYCPLCINEKEDYRSIPRYQQIPGVHICLKHNCYLKEAVAKDSKYNVFLPIELWDRTVQYADHPFLKRIGEDAEYLLNRTTDIELELQYLRELLWQKAKREGILKPQSYQYVFSHEYDLSIRKRYPEFPIEYGSIIQHFNLEIMIARNCYCTINPIAYLLLIRMWYGSVEKFWKEENLG